jgi:hypothetical protein
MTVITWPAKLPQVPQKGFTETVGVNIIRSTTDAGPAKQRRRASRPNVMNLSFIMTTAQTQLLEAFITKSNADTSTDLPYGGLNGVARFTFPHPRILGTNIDVRIVPGSSGEFFTLTYIAPGYWSTSLQMEIMP